MMFMLSTDGTVPDKSLGIFDSKAVALARATHLVEHRSFPPITVFKVRAEYLSTVTKGK